MNILRSYKRTKLFLWINIVGLAIGLATSIMLVLFVINELSYNKHYAAADRIISLNSSYENGEQRECLPIAMRKAMTDIPPKVPGIEYTTQIYNVVSTDLKYDTQDFQNIPALMTEASFCDVFDIKFILGNKDVLNAPGSVIISERYANIIFGSPEKAINKTVKIDDNDLIVGGVVETQPLNTQIQFDLLISMNNDIKSWPSIEFFTFYKIKEGASIDDTRTAIEKEYTSIISEFLRGYGGKAYGTTEKLTDLYLNSQAASTLGTRSSIGFVWLLVCIAILILSLAIINFVNLFIAQGETRMLEIGVRKANGATNREISQQFFIEISTVVSIAFLLGFIILIIGIPHFSKLINRHIDLVQLYNPIFIGCAMLIFVTTIFLSAIYPTIYLGRFNTLDILAKRISFSKRKLTSVSITFQAVVSIVIISFILVVNSQTNHLKKQPLGYNPENVLVIGLTHNLAESFGAVKQELEKQDGILKVSNADHTFGGGPSGQGISLVGESSSQSIDEYRINAGLCDLLELQLVEGTFYKEDDETNNNNSIILNEAAIRMLGLQYPVVGQTVDYKGNKEIRGVVKNFYYGKLEDQIEPIVLSYVEMGRNVYIKYAGNISHSDIEKRVYDVLKKFDSAYAINPNWLEDVYTSKFNNLEVQSRILTLASSLAIFISMIGLLAIHMLSTIRRRKEVGVRRVNGASHTSIFIMLSNSILKWILIAGVIAIPIVYYLSSTWLNNYINRSSLNGWIFLIPILLQCIIAIIVTSGVTLKALSQNPVESLKND